MGVHDSLEDSSMRSLEFERFAAQAARCVAVMGFLYTALFAVVVENGGFGGQTAAPIAKAIVQAILRRS